ncbi:KICSTOR complex protein ITFG2-like isoform X1 [Diorhabda sublineata]|uniref:KICSTOR complex protein ITFG2-like isoform X1 n=1 Tax=Diorhabda sublineata TaxID=1163346 RepID=UPI0024E17D6C|nr:KICSTOR complex protein ITFG2-like isoform X1 [Diorhabda sublineata]
MRAVTFIKRIEFEFTGNIARKALTLGDIDNDGYNELIVGNQNGVVSIFKGEEKIQTISKLNFISCVAVGDIMNQNQNVLIIITADGWCYLYAYPETSSNNTDQAVEEVDGPLQSLSVSEGTEAFRNVYVSSTPSPAYKKEKAELICIHEQRIPANTKDIVIGDIDGDGNVEMVLGLTDRVVRSYKWISNQNLSPLNISGITGQFDPSHKILGKFVAVNKWECANQIGSITLHHALDGTPSILIAQPGGTFMRIKCQFDDITAEECLESSIRSNSSSSSTTENISSSIDYQFLGISRMRNQNISTEILGDLQCSQYNNVENFETSQEGSTAKGKPYALATLDGTIMLVQDEVILWAIAVDHQLFALTKLDVTGNGSDDIVACSWDGETYILDQAKNSVRFHLGEAVQAFHSGYYNITLNAPDVTCFVYVNFKNTVIIYYDLPIKELTCTTFVPDLVKMSEIFRRDDQNPEEALEIVENFDRKQRRELVEYLLYNVN